MTEVIGDYGSSWGVLGSAVRVHACPFRFTLLVCIHFLHGDRFSMAFYVLRGQFSLVFVC